MKSSLILSMIPLLLYAQTPVSEKYYRSEADFLKGQTMLATERVGQAHIRVLFDSGGRMTSKGWVDADGILVQEEIYEYNDEGAVWRRAVYDQHEKLQRMYVYGDQEEMSRVFFEYAFPNRDAREFSDRVTIYSYRPEGGIGSYRFLSVDNTEIGAILLDYFDSGLVKEERWVRYPGNRTVRLFEYRYDPRSRVYELMEYDSTGTQVSRVGLTLPEESGSAVRGRALVPREEDSVPSISGNILEESSEIIADIQRRVAEGWDSEKELGPLLQEQMSSTDLLYLKNGDTLKVDLVQITDDYVRFIFLDEVDVLTMPLKSVQEIERRDGKIVYPVIY